VKLASAQLSASSSKLDDLLEMLTEMLTEGRRVLLFSQFTSMLDLIKLRLEAVGVPFVELRGDTADRGEPVRRFEAGEVPLFLISLKAGGRGLNLTSADTVIHYDPWWNPAVEDQASDRAYRIGQTKSVFVYKLIAADTVEDRILDLQERKAALAQIAFGDEGGTLAGMDEEDINFLFGGVAERLAA
jgi:SNF2 family DNA or RNA helicase